jgi:hypothetical protein
MGFSSDGPNAFAHPVYNQAFQWDRFFAAH